MELEQKFVETINTFNQRMHSLDLLLTILQKPLLVDDRDLKKNIFDITNLIKSLTNHLQSNFTGEIKFIAEKIHKIDERLSKIESNDRKKIDLNFRVDGYELIKKPIGYDKNDPIEDPDFDMRALLDTLNEQQKIVVCHRFGLLGEKEKSLSSIGKILNLSQERIRQIESKSLRMLTHVSRRQLLSKITDNDLINAVMGKKIFI